MKKMIIIKDSGKIIWGKKTVKCRPIVKALLRGADIRSQLLRERRTYWIWITFEGCLRVRLGDGKVILKDDKGKKLRDDIFYHRIENQGKGGICQFVCKKLGKESIIKGKSLTKYEQLAIVFTEIESSHSDRREKMVKFVETMQKVLQDYQMQVFQDHFNCHEIDSAFLKKRLEQTEHLRKGMDHLRRILRDSYKVANGKDLYICMTFQQHRIIVDKVYDFQASIKNQRG